MAEVKERFKGEIDLSGLTDEEPPKKATSIENVDLTPYKEAVQDSWNKREQKLKNFAKGITVPAEAKSRTVALFREAAKALELGLGVEVLEPGTKAVNRGYNIPEGSVRIIVAARKRKAPKDPTKAPKPPAAPAGGLPKPTAKK